MTNPGGGKKTGAKNDCPPGMENRAMGGGGCIMKGGGGSMGGICIRTAAAGGGRLGRLWRTMPSLSLEAGEEPLVVERPEERPDILAVRLGAPPCMEIQCVN